jgi:hypothetical protein
MLLLDDNVTPWLDSMMSGVDAALWACDATAGAANRPAAPAATAATASVEDAAVSQRFRVVMDFMAGVLPFVQHSYVQIPSRRMRCMRFVIRTSGAVPIAEYRVGRVATSVITS